MSDDDDWNERFRAVKGGLLGALIGIGIWIAVLGGAWLLFRIINR
jgi:hypothetical protein